MKHYEITKEMREKYKALGFGITHFFNNGRLDVVGIYSLHGLKILDKTNGQKFDTHSELSIFVDVKKVLAGDYVETDEPVDMSAFEEVKEVKYETN